MVVTRRLLEWLALVVLWLLLAFKADTQNMVAAAAAALLTVVGISLGCRYRQAEFALPDGWAGAFVHIPWKMVVDTWLVLVALARQIVRRDQTVGELIEVPFDYGSSRPEDVTRLAITLYCVSVTPNTVAITTTPEGILIHQLEHVSEPPEGRDQLWPV